ncbi:MAG: hypothetical protein K0Q87_3465 [Neobacillus sp.]|jgi:hypothetical protein|nr:hypothetical protein [Neobacillus sp.]
MEGINMVKNINEENNEVEAGLVAQLSSYELLWKAGFDELDAWVNRLNDRDEAFLNATKHYVESVKRNQDNFKAITEQFSKELQQWERGAREELLMTTTTLQHFLPIKSYEDINGVVDDIQRKTSSILATPIRAISNGQAIDKYLETVEQVISFRRRGREKYIDSVKKTTNVIYENQKLFVNLFTNQVKSAIFPFQQYMRNATEPTKS